MAAVGALQLAPLQETFSCAAAPAACLAAVAMSTEVAAAAAAAAQQAVHAVAIATASVAANRQHGADEHNNSRSAYAPAAPTASPHEHPAHKHHHAQRLAKHDCAHGHIAHLPPQLASLDIDAQLAAVQVSRIMLTRCSMMNYLDIVYRFRCILRC